MTNSMRLLAGLLVSAVLTGAAGAQEPQRLRPQQVPPSGAEGTLQLTPAELEGLRTLEAITNRSTEGLTFERRPDGTIGVDLQGRFQHVLMATPGKDGRLDVTCHTGGDAHATAVASITPWRPVKGETLHRLQVPQRLAAPIRVAPAKIVTPEEK